MKPHSLLALLALSAAASACGPAEVAPPLVVAPYSVPVKNSLPRLYTEAEWRTYNRALAHVERALKTPGLSPTDRASRIEALITAQRAALHAGDFEQIARNRMLQEVLLPQAASPERDRAIERSAERLVALGHPDAVLMGRVVAALPSWSGGKSAARATLAAAELREATLAASCPDGGCAAAAYAGHPEAAAAAAEDSRQQSAARARLENVAR